MMRTALTQNDQTTNEPQPMFVSPRTVAKALGVSESTVKRWCDRDELPSHRTIGGHRKLPLAGVIHFVRSKEMAVPHPEVLGLPVRAGKLSKEDHAAQERFQEALVRGDRVVVEEFLTGLYLGGVAPATICDDVVATALHRIGTGWEEGNIEVYEEHRAVQVLRKALVTVERLLREPDDDAPLAVAASMSGDRYTIALEMCSFVLRHRQWRTQLLGPDHPVSTLKAALSDIRPRMFCLGINAVHDRERFVEEYLEFFEHAHSLGVAVVIGGQGLAPEVRQGLRYTVLCEDMRSLVDTADGMWMAATAVSP